MLIERAGKLVLLIGKKVSHYGVIDFIGGGGMGTVYWGIVTDLEGETLRGRASLIGH